MAELKHNPEFKTIQDMATEQLSNLGSGVLAEVAARFAQREITKRADKMVQALDKVEQLREAHAKLGPDQISYDAEGKKVSESFSKKRVDEINKSKSSIERLESAIAKAHSLGDYSDLNKLLGGNQGDKAEGGAEGSGKVDGPSGGKDN